MESKNDGGDLIAQIDADEAARRNAVAEVAKPSWLGRPAVLAASLCVFAASAAWSWTQMREPFPAPVTTEATRMQSARERLVDVRDAVEDHRSRTGALPGELAEVTGPALASTFGYVALGEDYVLGTLVGDELVWLESGDDVARFLEDGTDVPAPTAPTVPQP
ncbi:MAG: hypothetical protein KJ067_20085 [Vicinamibacteria bacterium]|nr:hypothetical protein [Vicinamibacteria bacterium]MCL4821441.1 hypothetical protein [Vicinamibacteria bacterium]